MRLPSFSWTLSALTVATIAACSGTHSASPSPTDPGTDASTDDQPEASAPLPFQAVPPHVYVAKVKNVLVGLPPSADELQLVEADPTQLKTLIGAWMLLPTYKTKMQRFFELAFQQTQVTAIDFADQAYPRQIALNAFSTPLLIQNAQESFARTMLQLISTHPLTEATTTRQVMMTTALKELYAFLDIWEIDDTGKVTDYFKKANPALSIVAEAAQGPIPIADTLDPTSPNYMHWYDPDVATAGSQIAGCLEDPIVYPANAITLHFLLTGSLDNHKTSTGVACPQFGGTVTAPQLRAADFSDWTMVTIRQPAAGESVTPFYDVAQLRAASELVLSIPRVGFYSTPAFFANWQTNSSNQMRVTMNQTLIVALGSSVDGTDTTATPGSPPPGLDTVHAAAPECSYCHRTLDPLRSIFSATYSWNYHSQLDPALKAQPGLFSFRGVIQPVSTMTDMGNILGQHPLFAPAWAQKLCAYVNSAPCSRSDPEFQRIVAAFADSNYSWGTLVTELLSSPITTNATETQTADTNGEVIAVSRRDHLCAALDSRLGLTDICGLDAVTRKQLQATVPQIVSGLPSDGYGRGSTAPVLPNRPTLFYRAGTENICEAVAGNVIDIAPSKQVAGGRYWSSTDPDPAITDFVGVVMALASTDPRAAQAVALLEAHFAAAVAKGASASDALKSTFVTACLAPSAVSIGL